MTPSIRTPLAAGLLAMLGGCAFTPGNVQGTLQPQTTEGPCTVKTFYLLPMRAVQTRMDIAATGQACTFTVLNPALQAFPSAVLVTSVASHGLAQAGVANGGRSALVTYTPQPGYVGPDRFTVTIEPNDHAIAIDVQVAPPR